MHLVYNNIDIKEWRPKCINYTIDINKKWTNFKEKPSFKKKVDFMKIENFICF